MQSLQFGILVGNLPAEEEKAMFRKSIYLFADLTGRDGRRLGRRRHGALAAVRGAAAPRRGLLRRRRWRRRLPRWDAWACRRWRGEHAVEPADAGEVPLASPGR